MPGVYISYPFCSQKCSFCNFASGVSSAEVVQRYQEALLEEIRTQAWPWLPETLYLGGGTPSLMAPEFLAQLSRAVPGENLRESTLECAPGTVTSERAESWRRCGIDRVSLGTQSFVTEELRQTGRRHTASVVEHEMALLRKAGLSNINLDLIAGLPGQTRNSWQTSLDWVARLAPTHVSVYIFEVDEDSRLGNEILLGGVRYGAPRVPPDDLTAELYETAVDRLEREGWQRYEISNFARPGRESRHNLKYWKLEPYLGFGVDAHSFDGRLRFCNPDNLEAYLAQTGRSSAPEASDPAEEHFFVGLRLMEGIRPTAAEWVRFSKPIAKWLAAGMLVRDRERLRLSPSGVLVSNEIFEEFVDA